MESAAIGLLLQPMLRDDELDVIPNTIPRDAGEIAAEHLRPIRLLEACPASLLKRIRLNDRPYKAPSASARAARAQILDTLCTSGVASSHSSTLCVRVALADASMHSLIIDDAGGDALDAVLAAVITALSLSSGALPLPPEGWSELYWEEGCIYY